MPKDPKPFAHVINLEGTPVAPKDPNKPYREYKICKAKDDNHQCDLCFEFVEIGTLMVALRIKLPKVLGMTKRQRIYRYMCRECAAPIAAGNLSADLHDIIGTAFGDRPDGQSSPLKPQHSRPPFLGSVEFSLEEA